MLAALRMLPHAISQLVRFGFDLNDKRGRLNYETAEIWRLAVHLPGFASALLADASTQTLLVLWLLLLLDVKRCLKLIKRIDELPLATRGMTIWETLKMWERTAGLPIVRL